MSTQLQPRQRSGDSAFAAQPAAASEVAQCVRAARRGAALWREVSVASRLRVIRSIRHAIAEQYQLLVDSVTYASRNGAAETLAAEIFPLAEACKFLEREAAGILAPRRLARSKRPLWLPGTAVQLRREPWGVVLIVGASNYPLLLTGVQALQALAAGNAVVVKPGHGATSASAALRELFVDAGLAPELMQIVDEHPQAVQAAVEAGINKLVLTGSAETGRRVQALLSSKLIPATMELSGCDALFVLPGADLDRAAQCLVFGLRLNNSATCIAPRRVFVPRGMQGELEQRVGRLMRESEAAPAEIPAKVGELVHDALARGARLVAGGVGVASDRATLAAPTILADAAPDMPLLKADVFAPLTSLVPVDSVEEALLANEQCPYALGATVLGPLPEARALAGRINAGCVVINDIIAPTADPRVPFGGRKQSGFGMTRGAAGLEEMTQLKAIIEQRGRLLLHLQRPTPGDAALLGAGLQALHGRGIMARARSAMAVVGAALARRKWQRHSASVPR